MTRWFATAASARWVPRDLFHSDYQPVGLTHAKTMGTVSTVCGRLTTSWPKLWEFAFELPLPPSAEACRECVELTHGA